MKKLGYCLSLAAVGGLLGMIHSRSSPTSVLRAAVSSQQDPGPPGATAAPDVKTFVGQIGQWQGKYVLYDTATRVAYKLDNQEKAKRYDGHKVKVKGTLDSQNNTIRVSSIELA